MPETLQTGKHEVYFEPAFIRASDLLERRNYLIGMGWIEVLGCYQCFRHVFPCRLCDSKDCKRRPGYRLAFNLKIYPLQYCRRHRRYYLRLALIQEMVSRNA